MAQNNRGNRSTRNTEQQMSFDTDDGSVEITGEHPNNPNERPISVPVDGDDGMPVKMEDADQHAENEPIQIISETEKQRMESEDDEDPRGRDGGRKNRSDKEDQEEAENDDDDDVTRELKRQRNRARRQANKDRQRKASDHKNSEIRRLQREVVELRNNQTTFTHIGKLDQDRQTIERVRDEAQTNFALAEQKMKTAFKNGDEEGHTQALKEMYGAQATLERTDTALRNIDALKKKPIEQDVSVDTFVQEKAAEFKEKHDWFDPDFKDRDSRRTRRISLDLINEGYKPEDEDYWDELDERIDDEIGKKSKVRRDDEEDEPEDARREARQDPPAKRKLPISNGGGREAPGNGAGDGKVSVSDITPMQRSILRQMGYAEGTKEWMEMAMEYKKKNRAAKMN